MDHSRQLQVLVLVDEGDDAVDEGVRAPQAEASGAVAELFWIDTRRSGTLRYSTVITMSSYRSYQHGQ
jgi:hypothetical protein